jgi:argininosuccinate synthase
MVNNCGVHVGVGEGCAASGPAETKSAIASVTVRIATVRVCMKPFISRPVYQTRLPRSSSRSRRVAYASRVLASASSRSRTFSQRRVIVFSRKSPKSLYDPKVATMQGDASEYDKSDARGFITSNALRLKLCALRDQSG